MMKLIKLTGQTKPTRDIKTTTLLKQLV